MKTKYIVHDLPKHPSKKYGKRSLDKITRIVVHHFAGKISIKGAAELHISKGWPGIGYWAVIDLDGNGYIVNSLDTVSYNVANGNTPTVGIALRGNWEEANPPSYMLETLDELIQSVRNVLGPLPVYVHSDFVNTACPGDCLRDYIRQKYPSPAPLKIPLSKIKVWWNKILNKDRGHL